MSMNAEWLVKHAGSHFEVMVTIPAFQASYKVKQIQEHSR